MSIQGFNNWAEKEHPELFEESKWRKRALAAMMGVGALAGSAGVIGDPDYMGGPDYIPQQVSVSQDDLTDMDKKIMNIYGKSDRGLRTEKQILRIKKEYPNLYNSLVAGVNNVVKAKEIDPTAFPNTKYEAVA